MIRCIDTFVNKQDENGDEIHTEPVKLCRKASQVWKWSRCAVRTDVLFDVKENKTLCVEQLSPLKTQQTFKLCILLN